MCDLEHRIRILMLGGPAVGKTAIVKRFLIGSFVERYRTTVEDLHSQEFDLGVTTIGVDIIDTCGDFQFPAMRRLRIATSHAFMFVYSTTSMDSFHIVKTCFEEFKEHRSDFQSLPIVVVGNKLDLASHFRQVQLEDVSEWLYCEQPKLKVKLMECSAKDNYNIQEIFKQFLTLSRILNDKTKDESSLKRRSSAYVSASSSSSNKNKASTSSAAAAGSSNSLSVSSGSGQAGASSGSTASSSSSSSTLATPNTLNVKRRSRSLIRRSSRKAKQQLRDTTQVNGSDCNIS